MQFTLSDYVMAFAIKGACTCGRCCDAPQDAEEKQPTGHTIDLTFFKVAAKDGASAEVFRKMVEQEFPHWLDGKEHNYLECGADIGDQGIALMTFGLGHILGVWEVLAPETIMPFLPDDLKKAMAGRGMVAINTDRAKAKREISEAMTP